MPHAVHLPLLDRVGVAAPCRARWEDMKGDERVRHCAECNMKVHNISAMARDDAEALLRATIGERLCIRLYRRADGTIITQDCPVGVAKMRRAARRALVRVGVLVGLVGAAGVVAAASADTWGARLRLRALRPFSTVCEWVAPTAAPAPMPPNIRAMAGERCISMPPTPPKAGGSGGLGGLFSGTN